MIEYKEVSASFKLLRETGTGEITGLASVFGNVDSQNEICEAGCFTNLPEFVKNGFLALGHAWDKLPIGTIKEAKQTSEGLWIRAEFHSTPEAQSTRTVMKERLERSKRVAFSIGYKVLKDAHEKGARILKRLELFEVSIVGVPANPLAAATGIKDGRRLIGGSMSPKQQMQALAKESYERIAPPGGKNASSWFEAITESKSFEQVKRRLEGAGEHWYWDKKATQIEAPLPPALKAAGDPIMSSQFGAITTDTTLTGHVFPPSEILQLIRRKDTKGPTVRYMVVVSPMTGTAAFIGEGALKPEVQPAWTHKDDDIKTVAAWTTVTRHALTDMSGLEQQLNGDLSASLLAEVANQVINGNGGVNPTGILNTPNIQTLAYTTGSILDQLYKAIGLVENPGYGRVNGIAMNPTDWLSLVQLKLPVAGGFIFAPQLPLIVRDSHLAVGTAIVADWSTATLYQTNGVIFQLGLKNDDLNKNQMTAVVHYRCQLGISKPQAFVKTMFV